MEIAGIHPLAEEWPIREDVLAEIEESIAANGLRHPLVVDSNGLLIDGRTRHRALQNLGIEEFEVKAYDGEDILEYIVDANAGRRHESTGIRAMIIARMMVRDGRRAEGKWDGARGRALIRPESGTNQKTWKNLLTQCGVVLDFKPDLADGVVAGTTALDSAYQQAKAIKDSAERDKIMAREKAKREKEMAAADAAADAQIIADLTQAGATKYLALIEDNTLTPKAAWSAHRQDTRKEREKAERERQVLVDRFTSMGKALLTCSSWGGYADDVPLMDGFDPDLIPGTAEYFNPEHLNAASHFINRLILWREATR